MGSNPFIAEIMLFAGNFAPRGYAFCDGQILSISQNTALFSILGTTYGGNGQTTFALPDLRGRVPVHAGGGSGPGLSQVVIGERAGQESTTLIANQMPNHNHLVQTASASSTKDPVGASPGFTAAGAAYGSPAGSTMHSATLTNSGGGQPISIRNPYLGLNYCIALVGIFPSRN